MISSLPSLAEEITPPSLKGEDKGDIQLSVVKKGRCQKHGIEARKNVITSKKLGNRKNGYEWSYSRKLRYSCRMENYAPLDHRISKYNKPEVEGT